MSLFETVRFQVGVHPVWCNPERETGFVGEMASRDERSCGEKMGYFGRVRVNTCAMDGMIKFFTRYLHKQCTKSCNSRQSHKEEE